MLRTPSRVLHIRLSCFGLEEAVFLDDHYVLSSDITGGRSATPVIATAQSLATYFGLQVTQVLVAPDREDWQWEEVIAKAIDQEGAS